MVQARDPRQHPKEGDVLEKHSSARVLVRQVVLEQDGKVSFLAYGRLKVTPLVRWREWAADAKVNTMRNTT